MLSRSPVKKTDIAVTLIGKGLYPMKKITDTLDISRSNQYTKGKVKRARYNPKPDDDMYLSHIRKITDEKPTYGYRRVTACLNRELEERVNYKRIYRIMRINHLLLPKYTGRTNTSSYRNDYYPLQALCDGQMVLRYSASTEIRYGLSLPWTVLIVKS